ncbi:hypothetical protein LTR09_012704 [Extremus antarcticus]|uniref:Gfd2/YDR514C-like C-terminal domain-containing protein n=1 Tax=Extremus antarcticus TaxID=702011 RepID=A0AAJ0D9L7_9PEZI|nr:hypothetical protein LTR09_012704 [Extremus antarcticus]
MEHAHFRPVEYSNLVNRRFVKGCPNSYGFGQSTWIRLADAPQLLARIFSDLSKLSRAAEFNTPWPEQRNVVLVGHGLANDESYIRQLRFDMQDVSNIIGYADTQRLAGVNMIALAKVLTALMRMVIAENGRPGSVEKLLRQIKAKPPEVYTNLPRAEYLWGGSCSPGEERRGAQQRQPRAQRNKMAIAKHDSSAA